MNKTAKVVGLCIIALSIFFMTTQPNQLLSPVLIVPFLLLFVIFFAFAKWLLQKIGTRTQSNTGLAALIASLPVVLLALQSLGQLTFRDVVMLLILFALTYFYMFRRVSSSS